MKVQNFAKKEGARATKDLHTAVRLQGRARQDLEDALQARFNLIASWKTFLTDAIRTWQEYATLFQQQEKDVQDKIQEAQDQFNQANVQLEQSQTAAGKVKTIVIKDEDEEIAEGQASISSASDKIHDSFKTLSTSLLQPQAQTEQIETAMQAAKRPRLSIPSTVDQSMETTEEGQNPPKGPPFTQAG
jgi:predicted  nucleic acid-binding Zn-ribbon protein